MHSDAASFAFLQSGVIMEVNYRTEYQILNRGNMTYCKLIMMFKTA